MGTQIALGQPGPALVQEQGCLKEEFCSLPETPPPGTPGLVWAKYSLASPFRKSNSPQRTKAQPLAPPSPQVSEPLCCHHCNPQHRVSEQSTNHSEH